MSTKMVDNKQFGNFTVYTRWEISEDNDYYDEGEREEYLNDYDEFVDEETLASGDWHLMNCIITVAIGSLQACSHQHNDIPECIDQSAVEADFIDYALADAQIALEHFNNLFSTNIKGYP